MRRRGSVCRFMFAGMHARTHAHTINAHEHALCIDIQAFTAKKAMLTA